MVNKSLAEFTKNTFLAADALKCPFFQSWFADKLFDITSEEDLIGVNLEPRQKKEIYALYMTIYPKFNRKLFAKAFGIAYGTARNWNSDKKVTEIAVEFAHDFIDRYTARVDKIVATPKGKMRLAEYNEKRSAALDKLFIEAGYYKNDYLGSLLYYTMHELSLPKEKDPVSDFIWLSLGMRFNTFITAAHGIPHEPEMIEAINELTKTEYQARYQALIGLIELGKNEEAIEAIEDLSKGTLQLIESLNFTQMQIAKSRK